MHQGVALASYRMLFVQAYFPTGGYGQWQTKRNQGECQKLGGLERMEFAICRRGRYQLLLCLQWTGAHSQNGALHATRIGATRTTHFRRSRPSFETRGASRQQSSSCPLNSTTNNAENESNENDDPLIIVQQESMDLSTSIQTDDLTGSMDLHSSFDNDEDKDEPYPEIENIDSQSSNDERNETSSHQSNALISKSLLCDALYPSMQVESLTNMSPFECYSQKCLPATRQQHQEDSSECYERVNKNETKNANVGKGVGAVSPLELVPAADYLAHSTMSTIPESRCFIQYMSTEHYQISNRHSTNDDSEEGVEVQEIASQRPVDDENDRAMP